jgi:hypothetical protein
MKQIPWLSLLLTFLAYASFGWILSQSIPSITGEIRQTGVVLALAIDEKLVYLLAYILAAIVLLLITAGLTAPIPIITIFVEGSLGSDTAAVFSGLVWTLILVLMVIWFEYFVRLLIMVGVIILARIELRSLGLSRWQCFLVIISVCIVGFSSGLFAFDIWGKAIV